MSNITSHPKYPPLQYLPTQLTTTNNNGKDLTPPEQITLQLVSQRFLALARDNTLWRLHCYEESRGFNINTPPPTAASTPTSLLGTTPTASLSSLGQASLRSLIQPHPGTGTGTGTGPGTGTGSGTRVSLAERSRAAKAWDPGVEREDVNWYAEYAARHGRVSFRWLPGPGPGPGVAGSGSGPEGREVKGIGVFREPGWQEKVMGPMGDGRVCVWDLREGGSGTVVGVSEPGILIHPGKGREGESGSGLDFLGLGECVSMDSPRRRAYMAVEDILNEVDLETLQVVSRQRYPHAIFALSQETDYTTPLTLATAHTLHIQDPRAPSVTASLFQPSPLSVLHPPSPHEHTILVAGRFPSILSYDRRFFPRLQSAVHSGGGLCSLSSAPSPRLFTPAVAGPGPVSHRVVACGEYKGRGSLELYNLPSSESFSPAVYQNRQSAASSKLLSVASHGTRIVYSDANGTIKWTERDARTEVRRWNINTHLSMLKQQSHQTPTPTTEDHNDHEDEDEDEGGLFANPTDQATNNEVARKIIPTGGTLNDDDILIWTGERIGCLSFESRAAGSGVEDGDQGDSGSEEARHLRDHARREREYARTMRRALERQADEVRRMGGFGL